MTIIKKSEFKLIFWSAIITFIIATIGESVLCNKPLPVERKSTDTVVVTKSNKEFQINQESVYYMICIAKIQYPEVVLRQAICETGHFKSGILKRNNNLFGFHNGKEYLKFDTLFDCCLYYKKWQREHYKGGDYYSFLNEYGYASDSCYINVLKKIKINV